MASNNYFVILSLGSHTSFSPGSSFIVNVSSANLLETGNRVHYYTCKQVSFTVDTTRRRLLRAFFRSLAHTYNRIPIGVLHHLLRYRLAEHYRQQALCTAAMVT